MTQKEPVSKKEYEELKNLDIINKAKDGNNDR